ncbi:putative toxin-antitoxin system toxin component, PIN family [Candidatus Micrarchaeota archaeon]|nr:putative toxin-antitoxin system toxin component, PIN family [Candidatus Micrarchaeota archaeon]
MGKKRIVVDTNNLISALGWRGNSRKLFENIVEGKAYWFASLKQVDELKRVLDYPRFGFSQEQKTRFLELVFETAVLVDSKTRLDAVKDDPSDNIILECAVDCGADFVISGDSHLLKLKEFNGIGIVKVAEFLEKHL